MMIINKNRPIRFKIKWLIIIILPEPRNDYNHTSGIPNLGTGPWESQGPVRNTKDQRLMFA